MTLLATDSEALLLAESDGVLVGSLIAGWDGWRAGFNRAGCPSRSPAKGIATVLLREGERRLRARGAIRLTAVVAEDDPVAMSFWQAAGYAGQRNRARFVRVVAD